MQKEAAEDEDDDEEEEERYVARTNYTCWTAISREMGTTEHKCTWEWEWGQ